MKNKCNHFEMVLAFLVGLFFTIGTATAEQIDVRWTGAGGNGRWDNAANWENNVIPGLCKTTQTDIDGNIVTNGDIAARAVFGPVGEGVATTIDLTNFITVTNVLFAAGAPSYTIGTSTSQRLATFCDGGVEVAEGVTTDQTIAYFYPCKVDYTIVNKVREPQPISDGSSQGYPFIANYGSAKLVLKKLNNTYDCHLGFYGANTGTIQVEYCQPGSGAYWHNYSDAKVVFIGSHNVNTWCKSFVGSKLTGTTGPRVWEIPEGEFFSIRNSGSTLPIVESDINYNLVGGGTLSFRDGSTNPNHYRFSMSAGSTAVVDVVLHAGRFDTGLAYTPFEIRHSGAGAVELRRTIENAAGWYKFTAAGTLRLLKLGNRELAEDEVSNLGGLELLYNANGRVEWIGESDTTDRTIGITAASVIATLGNRGTGTVTYAGTITQSVSTATFQMDAQTGPMIFAGTAATKAGQSLTFRAGGPGKVTVKGEKAAAFSKFEVNGGTLEFTRPAEGDWIVATQIVTMAANTQVIVPEGVTLEISTTVNINGDGCKINFVLPKSSKILRTTRPSVEIDSWCTINGATCYTDENGYMHTRLSTWENAVDGEWRDETKWYEMPPTEKDTARLDASRQDYTVTVKDGFPLSPKYLQIGAGAGADNTATLLVNESTGLTNCYLRIREGGELKVAGEGTEFLFYGAAYFTDLMEGGKLTLTDGAVIRSGENLRFGAGETTISAGAGVRANERVDGADTKGRVFHVYPLHADETARLSVTDTGHLHISTFYIGYYPGTTSIVDFNLESASRNITGDSGVAVSPFTVGLYGGLSVFNLKNGYISTGNWGFRVGAITKTATPETGVFAPTGVVNMTGGKISYSGWNNAAYAGYCGLIVGDGQLVKEAGNGSWANGTFNFAGGTLVSNHGYLMVGVGQGEGTFVQTGGAITHNTQTGWNSTNYQTPEGSTRFYQDIFIGLAGGIGRYYLTNGTVTADAAVYVGGATTNDLCRSTISFLPAAYHDGARQDAQGLLSLQGGTFKTTGNVYVGAYGHGRLALGVGGNLQAQNLVLSNKVESILAADLGDAGCGTITLGGKLVIAEGAKLVIDASELTELTSAAKPIVSAADVVGAFDSENIEILVPENAENRVKRRLASGSVLTEWNGQKGLFFRPEPKGVKVILR